MVTLSAVGENGDIALGSKLKAARRVGLKRFEARLRRGIAEGDVLQGINVKANARLFLNIQQGMAVQARDGSNTRTLKGVASLAMKAWSVLTAR
jgi:hypothetical protein